LNVQSWVDLFSYLHSGTYNNEWQIVDLNQFTPNQKPSSGLLWVLEEVPGEIIQPHIPAYHTRS
jgi:hypothetical protein